MIADKIKALREQLRMSQSELARKIGITRSSVNAWEQGISVPSTPYIVQLSEIFMVSTDYLLGVDISSSVSVAGLSNDDINFVYNTINYLRNKNTL